jgi:hypothetical protein
MYFYVGTETHDDFAEKYQMVEAYKQCMLDAECLILYVDDVCMHAASGHRYVSMLYGYFHAVWICRCCMHM